MSLVSKINNTLCTVSFLYHTILKEGLYNPFENLQENKSRPIYILANGPSLKLFLNEYDNHTDKYNKAEFFALNNFCLDKHFELIRPQYYVLSDPLFFIDTIYSERGHKTIETLKNKVTWDLKLFIPHRYKNSDFLNPLTGNLNITKFPFHSYQFHGGEKTRFFFYKKNLGNGQFGTVALNALYIAIQCGFKEIYIYGIDHNFFENLLVTEDNILCNKDIHFYGNEAHYSPIINHYGGKSIPNLPFTVAEFLYEKASIFEGHKIMARYAASRGVNIYNCSPNSMVDAYNRISN